MRRQPRRRLGGPARPGRPDGSPPSSARQDALRLLGRRDYTAKELRTRLAAQGHAASEIDRALADLAAEHLQSDERVAAAYARTAASVRGRGRLRIARELEARGIDRALVHRVTADIAPDDEAAAIAAILLRKHWPAQPTLAERRRMFQHLLRRGFSADVIGRLLRHREDE